MLANVLRFFGVHQTANETEAKSNDVVCDSVQGLSFTFEPERYMGNWYEIYHSSGEPFQPDSWTCSQASYTDLNLDDLTFKVYNSGSGRFFGPRFGVHGNAYCPQDTSTFGEGECFVQFFSQPFADTPNYQIIDTDYETYSIIYACHEDDMQYLWFMSRTNTLSDEQVAMMMEKSKAAVPNYDFTQLTKDVQNDNKCTYVSDDQ